MRYGYARVSTEDQSLDAQINKLIDCDRVYKEKIGAMKERPELDNLLMKLNKGDILVVVKLDRLGRSLQHLFKILNILREKQVELISLSDNIDTTTSNGRLMFNIIASFAEYEREMISERTKAGLRAVRAKGQKLGRIPGLSQKALNDIDLIKLWHKNKQYSVSEVLKRLNISRPTYYKYLNIKQL